MTVNVFVLPGVIIVGDQVLQEMLHGCTYVRFVVIRTIAKSGDMKFYMEREG